MTQRLRTWFIGAVLVVIGVFVGYALPQNAVSPKSEIGTVTSVHGALGSDGANFTFKAQGVKGTTIYTLEDPTPWQATSSGPWHANGQAPCLTPGARATVGVISVHPVGSAPGNPTVVWIECYH
ncbi:MAG TPA: hypothetical protein VFQ44_21450 [Streptosporangiaceae bacterium]|nr:hypothetical protein [Streptosporangiaceae bacterium]